MDETRFSCQVLLFGKRGQERLENMTVAIVGLGGLGSHVAQQLAYLGIRSFILIDHDRVSKSNLNRLIGATEKDIDEYKVVVSERLITTIQPKANIVVLKNHFINAEGFELLKEAGFVFGCVDEDGARLVLTEFCQAYEKPYMDIATDINVKENVFGGRILFSIKGERCLHCEGLLDGQSITYYFSTEEQRKEIAAIYGIPLSQLDGSGPSVVSLNGILASVAVNEFMVEVTGVRPAKRSLEYRGMAGGLFINNNTPKPDCYLCKQVYGTGEHANLMRYVN